METLIFTMNVDQKPKEGPHLRTIAVTTGM